MRALKTAFLVVVVAGATAAQSPEPPLADSRLTVHTLLREDIFSGFLAPIDMKRFERGERNIDQLMKDRPDQRANLLAWKGAAELTRATLAYEAGRKDEFQRRYQGAQNLFSEAAKLSAGNDGVAPITAGSLSVLSDRLPESVRQAAWAQAYAVYSEIWKQQAAVIEKMPVHFRGELLGGLAQSAQRSGKLAESAQHLDRMIPMVKGTPYEATANEWKSNPASMATTKLTCKNCHQPGRLSSRLAELNKTGLE